MDVQAEPPQAQPMTAEDVMAGSGHHLVANQVVEALAEPFASQSKCCGLSLQQSPQEQANGFLTVS